MASKQAVRLFNIGRTLKTWSIRVAKFFKHRVLSKRKHALIIGGDGSELNKLILAKLAKTWEIVQIQG